MRRLIAVLVFALLLAGCGIFIRRIDPIERGYTKAEVQKAWGVPADWRSWADGTSVWYYSGSLGGVVWFDRNGRVKDWSWRTL